MATIQPNVADLEVWTEWDNLVTAAPGNTVVLYDFFTVPQGPAKLKNQTSLTEVRKLTQPEWINVQSIGFFFGSVAGVQCAPADMNQMLENYWLEFWVGASKTWAEGPLWCFPAGGGLSGVATAAAISQLTNGVPNPLAINDMRVPQPFGDGVTGITIGQGQSFHVAVQGIPFALVAGLSIWMILRGVKSRGVA